jgi:hypothetical protein
VAAAILLSLAVAAAAQAAPPAPRLVLEQSLHGEVVCTSTEATCGAVDLYGSDGSRDTTPIEPGDHRTTTVQLRNAGDIAASGLDVSAAACANRPLDGGAAVADLCGTVTVAVACEGGGRTFGLGPQTLTRFGQDGSHTLAAPLAAGEATTCQFDLRYPADAPAIGQALQAVQPVTWTLVAPEPLSPSPSLSPSVPLPGGSAPASAPPSRGPLAFTGGGAVPFALAGVALLVVGAVLHRLSRRHGRDGALNLPPA